MKSDERVDDEAGPLPEPSHAAGASARPPTLVPSSAAVSLRMSRQRRRDTLPELALRQQLHAMGLRFRVDLALPGVARRRADVVFTRAHIAVFVDGCFWHGCPLHATTPRSNVDWWRAKLARNVARDRDTDARLAELGWTVLRFWEHEDMAAAATAVAARRSELLAP